MKHTRTGLLAFVLALVLVAVEPAAAQSVNSDLITSLNLRLLYVAIPITLLVEGILIYTVYRFRDNDDPSPTSENRRLEITWTIATAFILLFVGIGAFTVLGSPYISPTDTTVSDVASAENTNATNASAGPSVVDQNLSGAIAPPAGSDAVQIDVRAFQWGWEFTYPDEGFNTSGKLVVPTDRDVYLHIHSDEVIHAVHVPEIGLKQDAFPGQYHTLITNVTDTGSYQLYCAEYCGSGHSKMLANFTAMDESNYQNWVDQQGSGGSNGSNASSSNATGATGSSNATNSTSGSGTTSASGTTGSQRIARPGTLG